MDEWSNDSMQCLNDQDHVNYIFSKFRTFHGMLFTTIQRIKALKIQLYSSIVHPC